MPRLHVELSGNAPSDELLIVGSHEALGWWDPSKAARLSWTGEAWETAGKPILLGAGPSRVDFKFVHRRADERLARWEDGPNRVLNVPQCAGSFSQGSKPEDLLLAAAFNDSSVTRPWAPGQDDLRRWASAASGGSSRSAATAEEADASQWKAKYMDAARNLADVRVAADLERQQWEEVEREAAADEQALVRELSVATQELCSARERLASVAAATALGPASPAAIALRAASCPVPLPASASVTSVEEASVSSHQGWWPGKSRGSESVRSFPASSPSQREGPSPPATEPSPACGASSAARPSVPPLSDVHREAATSRANVIPNSGIPVDRPRLGARVEGISGHDRKHVDAGCVNDAAPAAECHGNFSPQYANSEGSLRTASPTTSRGVKDGNGRGDVARPLQHRAAASAGSASVSSSEPAVPKESTMQEKSVGSRAHPFSIGAAAARKVTEIQHLVLQELKQTVVLKAGFISSCLHNWRRLTVMAQMERENQDHQQRIHNQFQQQVAQMDLAMQQDMESERRKQREASRKQRAWLVDRWCEGDAKALMRETMMCWIVEAHQHRHRWNAVKCTRAFGGILNRFVELQLLVLLEVCFRMWVEVFHVVHRKSVTRTFVERLAQQLRKSWEQQVMEAMWAAWAARGRATCGALRQLRSRATRALLISGLRCWIHWWRVSQKRLYDVVAGMAARRMEQQALQEATVLMRMGFQAWRQFHAAESQAKASAEPSKDAREVRLAGSRAQADAEARRQAENWRSEHLQLTTALVDQPCVATSDVGSARVLVYDPTIADTGESDDAAPGAVGGLNKHNSAQPFALSSVGDGVRVQHAGLSSAAGGAGVQQPAVSIPAEGVCARLPNVSSAEDGVAARPAVASSAAGLVGAQPPSPSIAAGSIVAQPAVVTSIENGVGMQPAAMSSVAGVVSGQPPAQSIAAGGIVAQPSAVSRTAGAGAAQPPALCIAAGTIVAQPPAVCSAEDGLGTQQPAAGSVEVGVAAHPPVVSISAGGTGVQPAAVSVGEGGIGGPGSVVARRPSFADVKATPVMPQVDLRGVQTRAVPVGTTSPLRSPTQAVLKSFPARVPAAYPVEMQQQQPIPGRMPTGKSLAGTPPQRRGNVFTPSPWPPKRRPESEQG